MRTFNTTGPVVAKKHYCIPPLDRVDLDEILLLIQLEKYFVLHAPRQTGKTSTLTALRDYLNARGEYRCLYVSFETGKAGGENTLQVVRTLLAQMGSRAIDTLGDRFVSDKKVEVLEEFGPDGALEEILGRWAQADPKPLVLLVDEIDSLIGASLISVLSQVRSGFHRRPNSFPQSVVLCGLRDIRDYRIHLHADSTSSGVPSPFNIAAKSLRLGDFSKDEVHILLSQHTAETGQEFDSGASERIWDLTRGQPWLVNALAYQACFDDKAGRNRSRPIGVDAIDRSKETLIRRRVTHLDQLADKLTEDRVRRVILPMLAGSSYHSLTIRDLDYVRDLGLVARDHPVRMANPIYAEVIPRELTLPLEATLSAEISPDWYVNADGSLDVPGLMRAFQGYFREHSESWVERFGHREAGPQLVLHAYLHRVVNSGGRIGREYALGRRRTDLLVEWPVGSRGNPARTRKYVIECKVRRERDSLDTLIDVGREQTAAYMALCGAESGHLVIFDMRPDRSWDERVFRRAPERDSRPITVWGL